MHIRVQRGDFLSTLAQVQGVVEARKTLPILSHLLLEAGETGLSVFGTDLDVGIRSRTPAEILAPGAIALSAKKLYEIIRELPEAPVELRVQEELNAEVTCQRSRFKIKGLPKDEFPARPEIAPEGGLQMSPDTLRSMIQRVAFAISTDQTRYTLTGALLQVTAAEARMVATDGHRLAMARVPREQVTGDGLTEALLPRKALLEAAKALRDDGESIRLVPLGNQVAFDLRTTLLVCRLIDGQFPNYQQVLPAVHGRGLTVKKEELVGALKRTSTIIGDRTAPTGFDFKRGRLTVSCVNLDLGEAREEVEVQHAEKDLTVGFNARYILDFLAVVDEPEVSIHLNDPLSPALFRPLQGQDYSCVIMPMRI